jgi:hypothetical protein
MSIGISPDILQYTVHTLPAGTPSPSDILYVGKKVEGLTGKFIAFNADESGLKQYIQNANISIPGSSPDDTNFSDVLSVGMGLLSDSGNDGYLRSLLPILEIIDNNLMIVDTSSFGGFVGPPNTYDPIAYQSEYREIQVYIPATLGTGDFAALLYNGVHIYTDNSKPRPAVSFSFREDFGLTPLFISTGGGDANAYDITIILGK